MDNKTVSRQAIDIALRLLILFGLLYWCFQIISPFIMPVVWASIIAIAVYPVQEFLEKRLKFKPVWASVFITLMLLSIILVPAILFFSSVTNVLLEWKQQFEAGTFVVPEIPEYITNLPLIGDKLHAFVDDFNNNMRHFIEGHQSQIVEASKNLLKTIIGTGLGVLEVILAIIISGVLLVMGREKQFTGDVIGKIIGNDGHDYVELVIQTIRSVVKGVLGVAIIQSVLAGIGIFLIGIPHAPIWTLLCLVLSIVQVGPGPVLIAAIIYMFNTESTLFASLWTIYFAGVMVSDNILKPFLLGKGAPVPMLVIFLGVIGGFMLSGFTGLFTGAIILSIMYKMFRFWMGNEKPIPEDPKVY